MTFHPSRIATKHRAVAVCLVLLALTLLLTAQPVTAEDPFAQVNRTNLPLQPIDKEYFPDDQTLNESQGVYYLPKALIPEECKNMIMFACTFPRGCPDTPCKHKPIHHEYGVSMFRFATLYFPDLTVQDRSKVISRARDMPLDDIRQFQCIQPATWYDDGPFDLEPLADHMSRYMHKDNPRQNRNMFENATDLVRTRYLFNLVMREESTVSRLVTPEEKQAIFNWRGEHSFPQIYVWEFLMGEPPDKIWDYNANKGDYLAPYLKIKKYVEQISQAHKEHPTPQFTGNKKQNFDAVPEDRDFIVYQAQDALSLEPYRLALTMAENQFYKVPNAPLSIAFTDQDQLLVREEEGFDGDPLTLFFSTSVLEHDLLQPKKDRVDIPKVLVSSWHQDKFEAGRIPTTHSFAVTVHKTPEPTEPAPTEPEPTEPPPTEPEPTEPEPTEPEPTEPPPTEPEPTEPEPTEPEPTEPPPTEPEPTEPEPTDPPVYHLKLIKEYAAVPSSLEAKRELAAETLIGLYYLGPEDQVQEEEAKGIVVDRQKVKIASPEWNDDYSEAAILFQVKRSGVYELVELKAPAGYQRSEVHHRLTIDLETQNFGQGFEARVRLPNPTVPPEETTTATAAPTCPTTTCPTECPEPSRTDCKPKPTTVEREMTAPTLRHSSRIANIPASPSRGTSVSYTTPIPATGENRREAYRMGFMSFATALIVLVLKRKI